ncbi:MAG: hypothetical protein ACJ735_04380 [Actinomycetes bacterium]
MSQRVSLLDREVTVLVERLRSWSPSRWQGKGRADAGYELAARFAELGAAPRPLPRLDVHVLADQIALTGHDLVAGNPAAELVDAALHELDLARTRLGIT